MSDSSRRQIGSLTTGGIAYVWSGHFFPASPFIIFSFAKKEKAQRMITRVLPETLLATTRNEFGWSAVELELV